MRTDEERLAAARRRMTDLIARRGVTSEAVLKAMETVPRERFVPDERAEIAYDDGPQPIGDGQTISQPYVVALMIEAAGVKEGTRVLEVGAGSGYSVAVMAAMGARVFAIERLEGLTDAANARLAALGYDNVDLIAGDGTLGRPDAAPFDAIIVTAGGPSVPETLQGQLAVSGRLVIPVGHDRHAQTLRRVTRLGGDSYRQEVLGHVAFVPLVGAQGWEG